VAKALKDLNERIGEASGTAMMTNLLAEVSRGDRVFLSNVYCLEVAEVPDSTDSLYLSETELGALLKRSVEYARTYPRRDESQICATLVQGGLDLKVFWSCSSPCFRLINADPNRRHVPRSDPAAGACYAAVKEIIINSLRHNNSQHPGVAVLAAVNEKAFYLAVVNNTVLGEKIQPLDEKALGTNQRQFIGLRLFKYSVDALGWKRFQYTDHVNCPGAWLRRVFGVSADELRNRSGVDLSGTFDFIGFRAPVRG
jgi:hypothetical protein